MKEEISHAIGIVKDRAGERFVQGVRMTIVKEMLQTVYDFITHN